MSRKDDLAELTKRIETALGFIDKRLDKLEFLLDNGKLKKSERNIRCTERDVLRAVADALRGELKAPDHKTVLTLGRIALATVALSLSGAVTHTGELAVDEVQAALTHLIDAPKPLPEMPPIERSNKPDRPEPTDEEVAAAVDLVREDYRSAQDEDVAFDRDKGEYVMPTVDLREAIENTLDGASDELIERVWDEMQSESGEEWVPVETFDNWGK